MKPPEDAANQSGEATGDVEGGGERLTRQTAKEIWEGDTAWVKWNRAG